MTQTEAAAWVQAIGSIAAIVAAFFISRNQFRDAVALQRESLRGERRRRYEALTGLVAAALDDFTETLNALRGSAPNKWFEEQSASEIMEEFYQAFLQISPLEMPSSVAARALVTFRDRLKTAAWNANEAIRRGTSDFQAYMHCVEAMDHNLGEVRSEQQKLLSELAAA